ncbi:hypothetical protein A2U01_0046681, partial [Trifolium medium]|nr:hypothetical protein [Trifolium medium]
MCHGFEVNPTTGVFFSFFQIKSASPHSLVSLSSQPGRGRFSLYASNFKNYRDTFLHFRCGDDFSDLMFDNCGKPLFPFYWSPSPRLIKGARMESLSDFEQTTMRFFATFPMMNIGELLARETKSESLLKYLKSMKTISEEQLQA